MIELLLPSLAEKGILFAWDALREPEIVREIRDCIDRSIRSGLAPYDSDHDLQLHLHQRLVELLSEGAIESLILSEYDQSNDIEPIRQLFIDLGGDTETLPEAFETLIHRLGTELRRELVTSARRPNSSLFNLVNTNLVTAILAGVNETHSSIVELQEDVSEILRNQNRDREHSRYIPSAKTLLVGPIRELRLQATLNRADEASDRFLAAELYAEISQRLSESGHLFHSQLIDHKRAEALVDAGRTDEAYEIWLNQAAQQVESGRLWIAPSISQGLDSYRETVNPTLKARADAVYSLQEWNEHPEQAKLKLSNSIASLKEANDPAVLQVAVWFGEVALVDAESYGSSIDLADIGDLTLGECSMSSLGVRYRLLQAEVTGDWTKLLHDADSDMFSAADTGLIYCRIGRWRAFQGQPEEAVIAYGLAIEQLSEANLLGDTAGALRSISYIEQRYLPVSDALFERHELAHLVKNESRRFQGQFNQRSAALEHLFKARKKSGASLADALRSARRYLWEARISGNIDAESDARTLLGQILSLADETVPAIINQILTGNEKEAKEIASRSLPVDVRGFLDHPAPWIVATTLGTLSVWGDVLLPAFVRSIAPTVISRTEGMRQSGFGPRVEVSAWDALQSMILQIPEEYLEDVLTRIEPLVPRQPNHYRYMDRSILTILRKLYFFRPSAREHIVGIIVQCLEDPSLTQSFEPFLIETILTDMQLREAVVARASRDDRVCKRILMSSGVQLDSLDLLQDAEALVRKVTEWEVGKETNQASITSVFDIAVDASRLLDPVHRATLAEHLLRIASDPKSPNMIRTQALESFADMTEAIDLAVQPRAFEQVLDLIGEGESQHPLDQWERQSNHPLSRIRLSISGDLNKSALVTAGRLAASQEQADHILPFLVAHMPDEEWRSAICNALYWLKPDFKNKMDVTELLPIQDSGVRQLTVSLWLENPTRHPALGLEFARDTDRAVRLRLAEHLGILVDKAPELAAPVRDFLMTDSSALIREIAKKRGSINEQHAS